MKCPHCESFVVSERSAIDGTEMPDHALAGCTCQSERALAMTLFGPERIAPGVSPQRGTSLEVTWLELTRWIGSPVVVTDKSAAGGFTLARLTGGVRRKANVEQVDAIGIDHDDGTMSPEAAHERLSAYQHIVYTTWSHADAASRWRAILPLSRRANADEHAIVWARIAGVVGRDTKIDAACKDASRLWYLPARKPGGVFRALSGDGRPLDVDRILARVAARAVEAYHPPPVTSGNRYVAAALEKECANVAGAKLGTRNETLNRAVYALARLNISTGEIANALFVAARRSGLGETEARKTIRSALKARRGMA